MIAHPYITRIVLILTAAAVVICLAAAYVSETITKVTDDSGIAMEYETELFHTEQMISVNILMEVDDWAELLEHAIDETYYACDVEVNGTTFYNVGIRPKGNTSLTAIANDPNTDRYSFKLEFDHYTEGGNCFGLDKLILNNQYADATNMKEAIVYDMYQYLDTDASLYNYAKVSVNGEYWGVYLALEAVEESFLLRNYGTNTGELYKPEGMGMGGGRKKENITVPNERGFQEDTKEGSEPVQIERKEMTPPASFDENMPPAPEKNGENNAFDFMPKNGMQNGAPPSMGGSGADLRYTDDDLNSYETIWEGAVTDSGEKDHKTVIQALKQIDSGEHPDRCMDVENLLKYMAVHTFSVNLDSLSGNMAHNYYLYESEGVLNILPWDYNLAFGGMSVGKTSSASETIHFPIDTPFSGTTFFDGLLEDETYRAVYHKYLKQLAKEYVSNGRFDTVYYRIRSQIDSLVETDPTAFYSYEEYDAGAEMLKKTVALRAESITGQLEGTIPSTKEGQSESENLLFDTSDIDLKTMGEFQMGEGAGDNFSMETRKRPNTQNGRSTEDMGSHAAENLRNAACYLIFLLAVLAGILRFRRKRL